MSQEWGIIFTNKLGDRWPMSRLGGLWFSAHPDEVEAFAKAEREANGFAVSVHTKEEIERIMIEEEFKRG